MKPATYRKPIALLMPEKASATGWEASGRATASLNQQKKQRRETGLDFSGRKTGQALFFFFASRPGHQQVAFIYPNMSRAGVNGRRKGPAGSRANRKGETEQRSSHCPLVSKTAAPFRRRAARNSREDRGQKVRMRDDAFEEREREKENKNATRHRLCQREKEKTRTTRKRRERARPHTTGSAATASVQNKPTQRGRQGEKPATGRKTLSASRLPVPFTYRVAIAPHEKDIVRTFGAHDRRFLFGLVG